MASDGVHIGGDLGDILLAAAPDVDRDQLDVELLADAALRKLVAKYALV